MAVVIPYAFKWAVVYGDLAFVEAFRPLLELVSFQGYGIEFYTDVCPIQVSRRHLKTVKSHSPFVSGEIRTRSKADDDKPETKKRGRKPKYPPGIPKPNAQRNFTDLGNRIMLDSATKGFVKGYNAQAAVGGKAQVIVAADVTDEANDKMQVEPMVGQLRDNLVNKPREQSADSGYYSETNVEFLKKESISPLIPPDKRKHTAGGEPAPHGRIPGYLSVKERIRRVLKTRHGKAKYKLRKEIVEPVFGQIKQGRGFRSFLLRGLEKVIGEWRLICATHNLLKLFRSGYAPSAG